MCHPAICTVERAAASASAIARQRLATINQHVEGAATARRRIARGPRPSRWAGEPTDRSGRDAAAGAGDEHRPRPRSPNLPSRRRAPSSHSPPPERTRVERMTDHSLELARGSKPTGTVPLVRGGGSMTKPVVTTLAAIAAVSLFAVPGDAKKRAVTPSKVSIAVISSRPDLVTGDSALVAIDFSRKADRRHAKVLVGKRNVTAAFRRSGARRLLGLVTGLHAGRNVLRATLPSGRGRGSRSRTIPSAARCSPVRSSSRGHVSRRLVTRSATSRRASSTSTSRRTPPRAGSRHTTRRTRRLTSRTTTTDQA